MAPVPLPRDFPYDTAPFRRALRLHSGAVIALAIIGFIIVRLSKQLFLPAVLILLAAVLVFVLMVVSVLPPVWTKHSIEATAAVLRQGLFFSVLIPLKNIASGKIGDDAPGQSGVRVSRADATLRVFSSGRGVVRLDLKEPVMVRRVAVDRVYLDVQDPEGFLSCIRERRHAPRAEEIIGTPEEESTKRPAGELSHEPPVEPQVGREPRSATEERPKREVTSLEELIVPIGEKPGAAKPAAGRGERASAESGLGHEEAEEEIVVELEPAWISGTEAAARPTVIKVKIPKGGERTAEGGAGARRPARSEEPAGDDR